VAIPEGLPLAVSIAMALSVNKLKKDQILIKNVEAVETMAMVHDICVSKTGTMTTGKMNVKKYQLCDMMSTNENDYQRFPDGFKQQSPEQVPEYLKDLLKTCIIGNNDVRMDIKEQPAQG
jgi:P-type E1-E2 ATPase